MHQSAGVPDDPVIGAGLPGYAQQHELGQGLSSHALERLVGLFPEGSHEGLYDLVQLWRQLC